MPSCSGCVSRQIACKYDDAARQNLARRPNAVHESNALHEIALHNAAFNSNKLASDHATTMDATFDLSFLSAIQLPNNLNMVEPLNVENISPYPAIFPVPLSALPNGLPFKAPKVLYRRIAATPQAEIAMTMVKNVIESYPHMMQRKETFPPFISARTRDPTVGAEDIPEILKDCMGIAHMFATRTPESSKLIWRTIRMEQEKLLAQYETYSDHELQAGVQAVLIYMMMRLQDQREEHEDIEVPLLHTLMMLSQAVSVRLGELEIQSPTHKDPTWQDWLYRESRRRCITTARIMNMAFDIDRALSTECYEFFLTNPLPAKKVLWEAKDEKQWRHEYEESRRNPAIHRLTPKGEILGLQQTAYGIESHDVGWQEWSATQDGSGILVYLASQILA